MTVAFEHGWGLLTEKYATYRSVPSKDPHTNAMISGNECRNPGVSSREHSVVLIDHSPLAIFIIDDLHELGYDVIFVGKNRSLQAASDRFIDISPVSDVSGTVDAIQRLRDCKIVGVYPALEHVKLTEYAVKKALGLVVPLLETFLEARDKYRMKRALVAAQVPTASFRFIPDDEIASPPFAFPFIVKPNLGFASAGVQLVNNSQAFAKAVKIIRRLNRFLLQEDGFVTGTICEEFVDGPEYSVD
jgi:biotin carboxylase